MGNRMIIGIGHKARQGKDTIADYLVKKYNFEKIAFANFLKDEVSDPAVPVLFYYKKTGLLVLTDKYGNRFEMEKDTKFTGVYNRFISYLKDNNDYNSMNVIIRNGSPEKDRRLLQLWGDYRRTIFGKNYFVDRVKLVIEGYPRQNYVISDVRFKNEADMIRSIGGILIKVYGRETNEKHLNHISENDLNDYEFDYEICNNTTFGDLYYNVDMVLKDILNGVNNASLEI